MRILPNVILTLTFGMTVIMAMALAHRAMADEPASVLAQTSGGIVATTPEQDTGSGAQLNPQLCTLCYQQLQKDNHDCESLKGQDWTVCREAATSAYRQCSQGC